MQAGIETLIERFQTASAQKTLVKLLLTAPKDKSADLKKVIITAVELKKGYCLNMVYRHATKDITKNYSIEEGIQHIAEISLSFNNMELVTSDCQLNLYTLPNGKVQLKSSDTQTAQPALTFAHDKAKEKLIDLSGNVYLHELGITNAAGELRREMSDKFRQINKYIELLAPNLRELKEDSFHVADMGSGKGYLTFALYDYLTNRLHKQVKMTGIEYRNDLVEICNDIASKAEFDGLLFKQGTIADTATERIDILIALHACNTATDDAIFRGIRNNASLIICAPCCHKQIRQTMHTTGDLAPILKFGILKERQAEILTDSLRALIMEVYGYKTNVMEFISMEHTPKNLMIVGRKMQNGGREKQVILEEITAIKKLYGIDKHYLETLLGI